MAIWDALSGKIYRWNAMKAEALDRVCKGLKPFVSSRLPDCPDGGAAFADARNRLFAFYMSASSGISQELDAGFAGHKERFYSFDSNTYLHLISAFHTSHVLMAYSNRDNLSFFHLMCDGIIEMYRKPPGYFESWRPYVIWYSEEKAPPPTSAVARLSSRLYAEIAPLLGLPADDIFAQMYWFRIGGTFVRGMDFLYKRPDWAKGVEEELAAH
jgi:hypothetical protein